MVPGKPITITRGDFSVFGTTLDDVEETTPEWLWEGYMLIGKLNGLVGDADKGKSLLTLDIASRVTRGWAMPLEPGDNPTHIRRKVVREPADVILVCAEDDAGDTIKPRMRLAGADMTRVHLMNKYKGTDEKGRDYEATLNLSNANARDWLKLAIDAVDARLLVVDPLGSFIGSSRDTDANREQDVRNAMGQFKEMLSQTHCAFLAIRHRGKDTKREPMSRALGSQAFTAIFRSEWAVDVHPEDATHRILNRLKCNLASADTPSLEFHIEADDNVPHIVWDGESDYTAHAIAAAGSPERQKRESPRPYITRYVQSAMDKGRDGLPLHLIYKLACDDEAYPASKERKAVNNVVHEMVHKELLGYDPNTQCYSVA